MSRVFVVQNQHKMNNEGNLEPRFDFSSAKKYGELVYLLSPSARPFRMEPIIRALREKLEDYGDEDYLLLIGNPNFIGAAYAIAADFNDGFVRTLQWSGSKKEYVPLKSDNIFGKDSGTND